MYRLEISKRNNIFKIVVTAFRITSVSRYVQIFVKIFLFANALQRPTC